MNRVTIEVIKKVFSSTSVRGNYYTNGDRSINGLYLLTKIPTEHGTLWSTVNIKYGSTWATSHHVSEAIEGLTLIPQGTKVELEVNLP